MSCWNPLETRESIETRLHLLSSRPGQELKSLGNEGIYWNTDRFACTPPAGVVEIPWKRGNLLKRWNCHNRGLELRWNPLETRESIETGDYEGLKAGGRSDMLKSLGNEGIYWNWACFSPLDPADMLKSLGNEGIYWNGAQIEQALSKSSWNPLETRESIETAALRAARDRTSSGWNPLETRESIETREAISANPGIAGWNPLETRESIETLKRRQQPGLRGVEIPWKRGNLLKR